MRAHALLSASGAERWLRCPPSARLEETLPESSSDYAAEGTLAHSIAELKLRKQFVEPMGPRTFSRKLNELKKADLFQDEMLRHTDVYLEKVQEIAHSFSVPPHVAVEKRTDFSTYAPEGFGTCDCVVVGGESLYIIDFKYGKGVPVSAEDNSQMKLYALGILNEYTLLFAIEKVILIIVQPRLDSISEWETTPGTLRNWGETTVSPAAQQAFAGSGEFISGGHCRFCRAKAICRARAENNTALQDFAGTPLALLSAADVGTFLAKGQFIAAWIKDLEEYALTEILKGSEIPGWKAVHGRSVRSFKDLDAAFEAVKTAGYAESVLYERKPIPLTAVEKLLGKPKFSELLTDYIETPPGKPTLAPQNDKREAIQRTTANEDFIKGVM